MTVNKTGSFFILKESVVL